jgi:hypothetical protein
MQRESVTISGKTYELTLANLDHIVDARIVERKIAAERTRAEERIQRIQRDAARQVRRQREREVAKIEARRASAAALAEALKSNPLKDSRNIEFLHLERFAEDTAADIAFRINTLITIENAGKSVADYAYM